GAALGLAGLGTVAYGRAGGTADPAALAEGYALGLTLAAGLLLAAVLIAGAVLPRTAPAAAEPSPS
ncbi:MFS transporter, partial [Nonomuraea wenchangensis]